MSDTIDVGIDLGTTNSAIALYTGGDAVVVKNNENADITPSAVWIRGRDQIYVGARARQRAENDAANTAREFKQMMGYEEARWHFADARVTKTPEELSAEILKSLRRDVTRISTDAPDAAVITIPAAFALNQRRATLRAAELAGLGGDCPLVQEPTAAAFAYALREGTGRGYWLVFDFGGGTFDAAIVDRSDDELRVLTHAGDRNLGGKLIDWALVEHVLAPAAAREFGLDEFTRGNSRWRSVFEQLKSAAEQAKIDLSHSDSTVVYPELKVGDSERTFEHTLRREQLETLAEPFYARAINLAREAITDSALDVGDIDRVLLVGGTTLAPGLRRRLADPRTGLAIDLEFGLDPTTVVARGAALFAHTVRRPPRHRPDRRPDTFELDLTHEPTVTTTSAVVAGRVRGTPAGSWTEYSVFVADPDARPPFRSARIPLNDNGAFSTMVDVDPERISLWRLELVDATGTPCPIDPDTFELSHRAGPELGGVRLAESLGVRRADEGFTVLLHKGATLPTTMHKTFKTSRALRRGDLDSVLSIPIAEGERGRGERNRRVGVLEIRSGDVRVDVPEGSAVEVTFVVDVSGIVMATADIPLADVQIEAEIDLNSISVPTHQELEQQFGEIAQRLAVLPDPSRMPPQAAALRRRLDQERALDDTREQVVAAAADPGAAVGADDRIRDVQAILDDIADAMAVPALIEELTDALAEITTLVDQGGDASDLRMLTDLKARAEEAGRARDPVALRRHLDRAREFAVELLQQQPDFPYVLFHALQHELRSTPQATSLLREGSRAADRGDMRALMSVNHRLRALLPAEVVQSLIGVDEWW